MARTEHTGLGRSVWWQWWVLWRYPNGLTRWKHCPFCEGHGARTWASFARHLVAHVRGRFTPAPPIYYGPVDVRCPVCSSRKIKVVGSDWPPVTGFCCNAGHAWGQFL